MIKLRGAGYLPDDLLLTAVILLCAYAALLWLIRRGTVIGSAHFLTLLLAGVVLLEAGLNTLVDLRKTHQEFGYKDRAAYTSYNALLEPVIAQIQRSDAGFYRIEKTFFRSDNDALGLGYRGVHPLQLVLQPTGPHLFKGNRLLPALLPRPVFRPEPAGRFRSWGLNICSPDSPA